MGISRIFGIFEEDGFLKVVVNNSTSRTDIWAYNKTTKLQDRNANVFLYNPRAETRSLTLKDKVLYVGDSSSYRWAYVKAV